MYVKNILIYIWAHLKMLKHTLVREYGTLILKYVFLCFFKYVKIRGNTAIILVLQACKYIYIMIGHAYTATANANGWRVPTTEGTCERLINIKCICVFRNLCIEIWNIQTYTIINSFTSKIINSQICVKIKLKIV